MPVPVARAFAGVGEAVSRVIRRPPMLSRGQLYYFRWQARPDSSKAQHELGWQPTPLEDGVRKTLSAMRLLEKA
jgi:dihydroflavonol-4-reductase